MGARFLSQSCLKAAVVCLAILLTSVGTLQAAVIGTLRGVTGAVDIIRGGKLPALPVKNGDTVSTGDLLRTKSGAFAEVAYTDGTVLRIAPRSRVDIGEHFSGKKPDGSEIRLTRGKIQAVVDLKNAGAGSGAKKFEVRTPNAIAGVRGTDFSVSHNRSVTGVFVRAGSVYSYNLNNPGRIVTLTPGTVTTVQGRRDPSLPRPALRHEIQNMDSGQPSTSSGSGGTGSGPEASTTPSTGGTPTADTGGTQATDSGGTAPTTGGLPSAPTDFYAGGDPLASAPVGPPTTAAVVNPIISPITQTTTLPAQILVPPPPMPSATTPLDIKVKVNF